MYAGCFQILSIIPPHKEISPPPSRCIFVDASRKKDITGSLEFIKENIDTVRAARTTSRKYTMNNFGLDNMLTEYMQVYESLFKKKSNLEL